MVCLGNEQRSFCRFWVCIQVLHFGLLLTVMAAPFLFAISWRRKWQSRRMCTHFPLQELQNYSSLLNNRWQENVESHQKKDTSHPRAKKLQQDSRRGEIMFRIKPHTYQRHWECSNKPGAPGPGRKEQWPQRRKGQRPHKRLTQTCLWVSWSLRQRCGSAGERGSDPMRDDPDLPVSAPESLAETWVSRRKGQRPHERCPRLACECRGVSGRGVGQQWPAAGLGALSAALHAGDLLKEVAIVFISTVVWPQVKQQGGNAALPINRKSD